MKRVPITEHVFSEMGLRFGLLTELQLDTELLVFTKDLHDKLISEITAALSGLFF